METLPPSYSIRLREVVSPASFVGCGDLVVRSVSTDSRTCGAVDLFACLPGANVDGHEFAAQAIDAGARALLVERPIPDLSVPQCVVPDARQAYGLICHALVGNASSVLKSIGVTGTNGKTTTTYMLRHILEYAGRRTGLLGTVECSDGLQAEASRLTTPDPATLAGWFQRMYNNNCGYSVLEVSSHALLQKRIAGVSLGAAIVTNITQDHLDYHGDLESYIKAKSLIAEYLLPGQPLIWNADCENTQHLVELCPSSTRTISFGEASRSDVRIDIIEETSGFIVYQLAGLEGVDGPTEFRLPMIGSHNVENATAATIAAVESGVPVEVVAESLSQFTGVPGRLERISTTLPVRCYVDYAHTPDALKRVLQSLKRTCAGRLICVFGAGGDRDISKRPLLGQAAMEADLAIVTSDNPRSENPQAIIGQIVGHPDVRSEKYETFVDRQTAIAAAVEAAEPDDCIVICGKGHETTQTIGSQVLPFDDRQVLRSVLREKEIQTSLQSIQASA